MNHRRTRRRVLATLGAAALAPAFPLAQPRTHEGAVEATLRVAFPVAEDGFDPAATSDLFGVGAQLAVQRLASVALGVAVDQMEVQAGKAMLVMLSRSACSRMLRRATSMAS